MAQCNQCLWQGKRDAADCKEHAPKKAAAKQPDDKKEGKKNGSS